MDVTILIVDDEESIRYTFNAFFSKEGYHVLEAEDFKTACKIIKTTRLDVIFSDILLKEFNGIDLLRIARKEQDSCPVIMITGQPDLETAGGAVRLGAFDYLIKPIEKETIVKVAKMALNFKQLEDEKRRIANENIKYRKNLEAIFRSVSEAIVTFDYEGVILNANDATLKVCGVSPKEIIGKKSPTFFICLHFSMLKFFNRQWICLQKEENAATASGSETMNEKMWSLMSPP